MTQERRRHGRTSTGADWVVRVVYLRLAAVKAGAIHAGYRGRFGGHTLRHSLATFFSASEISLPIIESMMRHAKPTTTAIYTHRVNAAQMAAQGKYLEAINVKPTAN